MLYLRISLDSSGKRLGVKRQRKACLRIAKQRGWMVIKEYVDNSISAFDRKKYRPAYEEMRSDFLAGRFTAVICWDLDRLSRQPRQLEDWIEAAEENALLLITANGEADLTMEGGRTYARSKMAFARGEMEKKSARQVLAAEQRSVKRRKLYGGTRLTGYTSKGKVIEEEAETVRRIFKEFSDGDFVKVITERLQEDGVPTRTGRPWNRSTVHDMLRNPKYAGRQVYKGTVIKKPGKWLPIIDGDLFDEVQRRFDEPARKRLRKGTARRYMGSGLYRCGICDGAMQIVGQGPTYACRTHVHKTVARVDEIVMKTITDRLAMPDVIDLLTPRNDERVAVLGAQVRALTRRIEATEADYDNDVVDGIRFNAKMSKLSIELAAVQGERADLLAGSTVGALLTAPDPAQRFVEASLGVQRAVMDALLWVVLLPNEDGTKKFQPDTVSVRWRRTLVGWDQGWTHTPEVREEDVLVLSGAA